MAFWSILRPFGLLCGHLVLFYGYWVHFSRFGMFYQEKSGNPVQATHERDTTGPNKCQQSLDEFQKGSQNEF
jgi:hypothetical protein